MGTSSPTKRSTAAPTFEIYGRRLCLRPYNPRPPCLLWPNGWMDQDAIWYESRPRPRPDCVRWGPSSPSPPPKEHSPQFSAHVCCGQTAGWIKMPLGTKVGLGQSHNVLDGDPAPSKGVHTPIFGPCLLWPNGRPSQLLLSTCTVLSRLLVKCIVLTTTCYWSKKVIIEKKLHSSNGLWR